ncbi:MAG: phosphoadenylyl-sulfate reductase [Verrucomicrobia bacterium]|nr:phosphoadenylyl-sulfate reductase [Verrucomicrobiota bacterium]
MSSSTEQVELVDSEVLEVTRVSQAPASVDYDGDNSAEDVLRWALDTYHPRLALATSFKDAVIIHLLSQIRSDFRVFALDTGRLNEETYECAEAIRERYGVKIEWVFPKSDAVEKLERERGVYSFRQSLENRRECCSIRKVEPLRRALQGLDAWITGLRRDQGVTRTSVKKIERDDAHGGIVKINPIADWDTSRVWDFIRQHDIPYNKLFDQGYASIGCAPCTRAIKPGDDPRSGRWWWEEPEHKECGLHIPNYSI